MEIVNVEAIFFDVDGTLVDSRKDIAIAMNFALRGLGLVEKPEEVIVSYIGTGVRDLIKKSIGNGDEDLIDKGVKLYSDHYMAHAIDHAGIYPGVVRTLEHFSLKRKFILTNRYSGFADATLKGLGLRGYFEDIIGGDDESCLKPSACVMDRALPRFGLDRTRSMIVGDMAIDIMTGKNSGIRTCFVTYGLGKLGDVETLGPDFVIGRMDELIDIIK